MGPIDGRWFGVPSSPRRVQTPVCPLCDQLPTITLPGGEQAFCGTESCPVICWNPSASLDDNLTDVGHARTDGTE